MYAADLGAGRPSTKAPPRDDPGNIYKDVQKPAKGAVAYDNVLAVQSVNGLGDKIVLRETGLPPAPAYAAITTDSLPGAVPENLYSAIPNMEVLYAPAPAPAVAVGPTGPGSVYADVVFSGVQVGWLRVFL